jgi:hypothetical protein
MWHMLDTSEMRTKFWSEHLNGRDHLEDLSVDGRTLKWILNKWFEVMDCIHLSQGKVQWWAFVKTTMNIQVI